MKTITIVLMLMLSALLFGACGTAEDTADVKTDAAVEKTEKAVEAVATSATATGEEYVGMAAKTVDEWTGKIEEAKKKMDALPAMAQKPLEEPMKTLVAKGEALTAQFDKLKAADVSTFATEKDGMEKSVTEVKDAYSKVEGLFK